MRSVAADGPAGRVESGHVVERYRTYIYNLALRILRHPEDSEDATQDVLVRVVRFLPSFENRSDITTWLYRVTYNVCMNRLRERERARSCCQHLAQANAAMRPSVDPADRLMVCEAVGRLPAMYRRPLVLFFFHEMSYRQIGHELQLPINTVKIRIHRAKKLMQRTWARDGDRSHADELTGAAPLAAATSARHRG